MRFRVSYFLFILCLYVFIFYLLFLNLRIRCLFAEKVEESYCPFVSSFLQRAGEFNLSVIVD